MGGERWRGGVEKKGGQESTAVTRTAQNVSQVERGRHQYKQIRGTLAVKLLPLEPSENKYCKTISTRVTKFVRYFLIQG